MGIPGTVLLDRYRIVRPLARGASSVVYLAFDEAGTPYSVKLFPAHLAARADREYLVGQPLHHPHLNRVFERVEVEGQPGVLMAFAPGERLSDWRSAGNLPGFLAVFAQTLSALAHMHAHGFVHRDLKPENVIVAGGTGGSGPEGSDAVARLLDFDLAGPGGEVFRQPVSVGTAAFLSPEAALGHPLTPASDLYAAGVLLYWGLVGELPFEGSAGEVVQAHLSSPAPALEPDRSGPYTERLASVVARLLAKRPADRYPDALSVLTDLPPGA